MSEAAELLRLVLLPFLLFCGSLLTALIAYLFIQRLTREIAEKRRQAMIALYRPLIDAVTCFGVTAALRDRLEAAPPSHRRFIGELLLAPLRTARGDIVTHVREAAQTVGLTKDWLADLTHRRWWRRADGVRALGAVEERSALSAVLLALDDDHEEVRAAAVEAAGRLGDLRALPALLGHLGDGSRYQRARVIEALRNLGPAVTPGLVEFVRCRPELTRLAAEIFGMIGTVAAIDPLLEWCDDRRGDVRAAALHAIGSLGIDDRSYYFVLRGLGDADPHARAMAARALGRGRREDAVSYLAERLDDEWLPAAQAAGALQRLGAPGRAALEARARDEGQAGDLARQMLWTRGLGPAQA